MWIQRFVSAPPASVSTTRVAGSSLSRAATAQPAEPAPITMKSASIVGVVMSSPPLLSKPSTLPPVHQGLRRKEALEVDPAAFNALLVAPRKRGSRAGDVILGSWIP